MPVKAIDLTGRKLARLLVLRQFTDPTTGLIMCEVRCDCGTVKVVRQYKIGHEIISCGCALKRRRAAGPIGNVNPKGRLRRLEPA